MAGRVATIDDGLLSQRKRQKTEMESMFRQPGWGPETTDDSQDAVSTHDLVGAVPLFERLSAPLHRQVSDISRVVTAEPAEVLARQGDTPEFLYVLLKGHVALSSAMADGTAAVVSVANPGEHFVLPSVLAGLPYLMTARAVVRSQVLAIDAKPLLGLVDREPTLASALLHSMSLEFRGMVRQVRDLKLRTAAQRLGCYLLQRVHDAEARKAEFRLPFDKGLLAAHIGCGQETLSRAFAALRASGVETHGSRVILHDIPRLRLLAVPDGPSELEAF
jgi:CRP/FNR family transcriptional activator FtrB